jgi:hypothetical protein
MTGMRSWTPPTKRLGSPTIMAANRMSSPPSRLNSQIPAKAKGSRSFRRNR